MKHKKKQKRANRARLTMRSAGNDNAHDKASASGSDSAPTGAPFAFENDTDSSEFDDDDLDDMRAMRMFTVPPSYNEESSFPDSTTQWLAFTLTQKRVFGQAGFPAPLPAAPTPSAYEVRPAPGMGMGVFATCAIKAGELILAERPLLVVPKGITNFGMSPEGLTGEAQAQAMLDNWETTFEVLVGRMTEGNRSALLELTNSHTDDGSGALTGIIRTNGCAVDELDEAPNGPVDDVFSGYTAIGRVGARFNHSCIANIVRRFDLASFSLTYTANRDIEAGAQIFTVYCNLEQSAAKRQAALAPYGITRCICAPCTNATPERDRFREEFYQRTQEHFRKGLEWEPDDGPPIASADFRALLEFQSMAIEEGLDRNMFYVQILTTLLITYKRLGLGKKMTELYASAKLTAALCGVSLK